MPKTATITTPATTRRAAHPATPRREPPWATEPLTAAEHRALAESADDFARGDYLDLDQAKAHVARLRSQIRTKKNRATARKG